MGSAVACVHAAGVEDTGPRVEARVPWLAAETSLDWEAAAPSAVQVLEALRAGACVAGTDSALAVPAEAGSHVSVVVEDSAAYVAGHFLDEVAAEGLSGPDRGWEGSVEPWGQARSGTEK